MHAKKKEQKAQKISIEAQHTKLLEVQAQNSPNLKGEANPKLTSQPSKGGLIQGFSENFSKLFVCAHMVQVNVSLLIVITQEVIVDLYVFGF